MYERLRQDPALLDFLHAGPLSGIWVWDTPPSGEEWLNEGLCALLGYEPGDETIQATTTADRGPFLAFSLEQIQLNPSHLFHMSIPFTNAQGQSQWISCRAWSIRSEEGKVIQVIGAVEGDKVAQAKPAENWKEAHDLLASVLDSQAIYVFLVNQEGFVTYINDYYCRQLQRDREAIVGTPAMNYIVPEDWSLCMETIQRCIMAPGETQRVVLGKKVGDVTSFARWEFRLLSERGTLLGGNILCVGYDVTEEVRREQDFQLFLDTITDGILFLSKEGIIRYASPSVMEPLGFTPDKLLGQPVSVLVHPEDQALAHAKLTELLANEGTAVSFVHRFPRPDGAWGWAEAVGRRAPRGDGIVVVSRDISLAKEQADRLQQLALIAEHTTNLVVIAGAQLQIQWINESLAETCGIEREAVIGLDLPDLLAQHQLTPLDREALRTLLQGAQPFREEWQGATRDGQPFWFEIEGLPVYDEAGQRRNFIAILNDISARKEADRRLEDEKEKYRTLVESAQAIYFRLDVPTRQFTYMDPKIEQLLGYPVSDWTDMAFWESVIHPADRVRTTQACLLATDEGRNHVLEYRAVAADGRTIWLRDLVTVVSRAGKPVELIGFLVDNTPFEEMKARSELQRHYLEAIYNQANILFYVLDVEEDDQFRYRFISPYLQKVIGQETQNFIGKTLRECSPQFFSEELATYFEGRYAYAADAGRNVTYEENIDFGGRNLWWLTSLTPVRDAGGRVSHLVGVSQEISDFKRASEELSFQASLLNAIGQAVIATDPQGNIIYWNQAASQLYGWEVTEVMGRNITDVTPVSDLQESAESIMARLRNGEVWSGEYRVRNRAGQEFPVYVTDTPVIGPDEELTAIIGVSTDISDRKAAEEALRESESRLRLLTNNMSEVFWLRSADHSKFLYINPVYEQVWGQSAEALYENAAVFTEAIHPQDKARVVTALAQYPQTLRFEEEYRIRGREGEILWVWARQFPFYDSARVLAGHTGIAVDITGRKQAEAMQRRAERMELEYQEMERFTYLASHDLKEPLRTITSFVSLIYRRHLQGMPAELQDYLGFIAEASQRMSLLINGLLTYSRLGRNPVRAEVDCQALVEEVIADLGRAVHESDAHIETGTLPRLVGFEVELRQLFQNLIANALKFHKPEVAPLIRIAARRQEGGWFFTIQDNGIGIGQAYQDKIFEIFQRLHQRHEYEGTGIGLANCKKIVELHGGYIGVESTPGQGSTFFFFLPDQPAAEGSASKPVVSQEESL